MLMRSPPRRSLPVGPLLVVLGVTTGLGLAGYWAIPQVVAVSPAAGAQYVASHAPIHLTFSRPMDRASVEAAIRLTPAISGLWRWAGDTLSFIPTQAWPEKSTITVALNGGRSERGLPLLGETTWTFTVSGKRLAYLQGDPPNVWITALEEETPAVQLTDETIGVETFDITPDGNMFVYVALRTDGGSDLRSIRLDGSGLTDLVICPSEACTAPALSPDGTRVAYERQTVTLDANGSPTMGNTRLNLFSLETHTDAPLPNTPSTSVRFPRWGNDGRLSYYDPIRQALVIRDMNTGAETYVPNTSGDMGSWSPDGTTLVFPEIVIAAEPALTTTENLSDDEYTHTDLFYSHLLRVQIATNQTQNLSGDQLVEDASPAYSPTGAWIAFGRKALTTSQWTPGRQLWVMQADGTNAQALTADPFYNHSAFKWSPDGTWLAYMRFNPADSVTPAEIWVIQADGTNARRLVTGGYLPQWLP